MSFKSSADFAGLRFLIALRSASFTGLDVRSLCLTAQLNSARTSTTKFQTVLFLTPRRFCDSTNCSTSSDVTAEINVSSPKYGSTHFSKFQRSASTRHFERLVAESTRYMAETDVSEFFGGGGFFFSSLRKSASACLASALVSQTYFL